jgi:hypothetical protein
MKNLLLFASVLLATSTALATDYSGHWSLDKERSSNLPPYYSQVKSHRLTNSQNEKQLVVAVEIDAQGAEPQKVTFDYNLDGTPSTTTTEVRTPAGIEQVPTTMAAAMAPDGKLNIAIVREVKQGGKTVKGESSEEWSLSPDGQTLTVHLVRQNKASDLVFAKQ